MKPEVFDYFERALEIGASDLILKPGAPPAFRVNRHLIISEDEALAAQQMYDLFLPIVDAKQQEDLRSKFYVNSIFSYRGSRARIRYYIFQQREGLAGSFRFIPPKVPSIKSLRLPEALINVAAKPRGLFLITGPSCSGKSMTIAAMADAINKRFARHIITMESPIEVIYTPNQSVFTQVEIGKVINTYYDALINALREDPDVMIIGELKERAIIEQALMAAETGHLVLSSLPTMGSAQTIEHIISMYPPGKQEEARSQLSLSLIGIFSQMLVPNIDPMQQPSVAYEFMLVNSAIRNLIRDKKYNQLNTAMIMAKRDGCVTLKDSLEKLMREEGVDQAYIKSLLQELEE
ncbi:MAG: type IV pili twitching motility protein PilT [Candidatus Riflebacteria bacterium HGW-Riflebacteria-1]|jgi:twitching motility protein PilT|nr:MAG: type IV pili twitching motility protein PilT [Candidatus Riflebacteria bacterium HGW-Riflebacteria-1]